MKNHHHQQQQRQHAADIPSASLQDALPHSLLRLLPSDPGELHSPFCELALLPSLHLGYSICCIPLLFTKLQQQR